MVKDVELVYIPVDQPMIHLKFEYLEGQTVWDVLEQSGLLQSHPEVNDQVVGIFSKVVPLNTKIKPGDRIEIYRPLLIDPKDKRRQRALRK